jgi:NAD(P)-dependent dehydrogenase (short-subunit alcohol dehydrogenase family)
MPQPTEFKNRLPGKVAVVTGAGSHGEGVGTGRAISCVFAGEGAKVCLVDLDADRAEQTRGVIIEGGGDAIVCVGDITQDSDCARIIDATVNRWGKLDILVNNVGISTGGGPLDALSMSVWDQVMSVNLRAAVLMTRKAIPHLIAAKHGAIVNIASIAALLASGSGAYGPSKAALISLTREVALMYGRQGVRANAIAPGHIYTPHAQGAADVAEQVRKMRCQIAPLGIEGDAWDVAAAALFLASDEARFITAVCLPVDAGAIETLPLAAMGLLQR